MLAPILFYGLPDAAPEGCSTTSSMQRLKRRSMWTAVAYSKKFGQWPWLRSRVPTVVCAVAHNELPCRLSVRRVLQDARGDFELLKVRYVMPDWSVHCRMLDLAVAEKAGQHVGEGRSGSRTFAKPRLHWTNPDRCLTPWPASCRRRPSGMLSKRRSASLWLTGNLASLWRPG